MKAWCRFETVHCFSVATMTLDALPCVQAYSFLSLHLLIGRFHTVISMLFSPLLIFLSLFFFAFHHAPSKSLSAQPASHYANPLLCVSTQAPSQLTAAHKLSAPVIPHVSGCHGSNLNCPVLLENDRMIGVDHDGLALKHSDRKSFSHRKSFTPGGLLHHSETQSKRSE